MPSICFFVATSSEARNDNHRRLPAAFAARGWGVHVADHDDLCVRAGSLNLATGEAIGGFDLVWIVGLGRRQSFLDRMQLLSLLPARRMVVQPLALIALHAKYALPLGPLAANHPETHASRDPRRLAAIVAEGGDWIAKPPASSFGREVYRLRREDPNVDAILDALTGHDGSRYAVLQRYVPEIERGETRVLTAGGRIITGYLRRSAATDHRANLAADGRAEVTTLTADEVALAQRCAEWLATQGVLWAAVDIAYPWIVEFNIANPGGLETLQRLTGIDHSIAVVDAIETWCLASG